MASRPAILCLHGSGTNSTIFNIQTIRIQRALSSQFTFVFPDAPHETGPGPGVLPVFEGCGPYFSWLTARGQTETPPATKALIEKLFADQQRLDGRGFVGVLGFSQGCRVAAGLLLEQQAGKKHVQGEGLGFGVFTMGVVPPLTSGLSEDERKEKIRYPTLHVLGLLDQFVEGGRMLYSDHGNDEKAMLLEFDVDHRLPTAEEDTAKIVAEILRMYRETSKEGLNATA